jgi:hypothetical protein
MHPAGLAAPGQHINLQHTNIALSRTT